MGIKLSRKKPRNFLIGLIYRSQKILPLSYRSKLKLFLNLEWIFDRLSHEMAYEYYTAEQNMMRQFSVKYILDHIKDTDVVLDLGCNRGEITYLISKKAKEVVGIDFDKSAIEIAERKYKNHNLAFYNCEALEFLKNNSRKFDVLILSHILEHLDNPEKFLIEFKGHFKKIYIELPDFDKHYLNHYRKDLKMDLIYSDNDHINEFDRHDLKSLLKDCNIKVEEEEFRFGVQKLWCSVS